MSNRRKRKNCVSVRFSDEELRKLQEKSEGYDGSNSAYIRDCALNVEPRSYMPFDDGRNGEGGIGKGINVVSINLIKLLKVIEARDDVPWGKLQNIRDDISSIKKMLGWHIDR
jgi:hypothetical protein